jgi:membrane protein
MLQWWNEFSKRPFVAHLLRAVGRFNLRGGVQLAAAIAYFSVLALVPVLMLAFSALGLTITVLRPDAMGWIEDRVGENIDTTTAFGRSILEVIHNSLTSWATVGLTALAIAIWVSSGWVGNLKRAVRLVMREDVDRPGKQLPLPLDVLANFAGLIGLLVGVAATFAAATISTSLGDTVGMWLGIGHSATWSLLLRLIGLVVAVAAGAVLFRLLFWWFSPRPLPGHLAWVGAGIGAFALVVLQVAAGYVIGAFSRNLTAVAFGAVIVVMLFLNMFATLLLYIAAWLATAVEPVAEPAPQAEVETSEVPAESMPGELYVSSEVARRSLGIGLGTGYVVGAATGLGIGAMLTSILVRLFGRRE